jgi:Mn2+/Fe2+ NRAMP family transporter
MNCPPEVRQKTFGGQFTYEIASSKLLAPLLHARGQKNASKVGVFTKYSIVSACSDK